MKNGVLWRVSLAVVLAATQAAAYAQTPSTGLPLSFEAAQTRMGQVSDSVAAADANVRSKEAQERSTRTLHRPEVVIDAREMKFKKTLELPLGPLAPLAAPYGISDPLVFETGGWRFRPELSATIPLYTGGQIDATQQGAQAQVRQAQAERSTASESAIVQLAQAYFGQQLAARAAVLRRDVRDGLDQHLSDAEKLEREGFASRAQKLQAKVARDDAEREYQKALNDLSTANAFLAGLLRSTDPVDPTTPLFVISQPLESVDAFRAAALANHPQIAKLQAQGDQARQGVRLQEAKQRPTVYGFAQYDLNRDDAMLTDPDWVFGVGIKYTILSGLDRGQAVAAAKGQRDQADAGLREARVMIDIGVTRAYNDLESARQQFLLLDSSIAQGRENLRLQQLSFREGQATSLDVIDAQLGLGKVSVQRAQAAYQYVMALVQLLNVSGQTGRLPEYVRMADKVIA